MTTIRVTFADGTTATRRTEAAYTHAAKRGGRVTFHGTAAAAAKAAGPYGEVVATGVTVATPARVCGFCKGAGTMHGVPGAKACVACGGTGRK
jgi:DnaJ-class molecular chaperone